MEFQQYTSCADGEIGTIVEGLFTQNICGPINRLLLYFFLTFLILLLSETLYLLGVLLIYLSAYILKIGLEELEKQVDFLGLGCC